MPPPPPPHQPSQPQGEAHAWSATAAADPGMPRFSNSCRHFLIQHSGANVFLQLSQHVLL